MIKKVIARFHWILSTQFGFDGRILLRSFRGLPRFLRDWQKFRKGYSGKLYCRPCLQDWYEEGGNTRTEYFRQDLLVAQMVSDANPKRHVDIGSRVDGFVAHVAAFREIEVFDIRPTTVKIPGILFTQADLMSSVSSMSEYCDSLSCLHALEHFGLGRYGDPVDPNGYKRGIVSMSMLLKPGGKFYLSVPVGRERVEFNAHQVFDPRKIVNQFRACGLRLDHLSIVDSDGSVTMITDHEKFMPQLAMVEYCLGIFTFIKLNG